MDDYGNNEVEVDHSGFVVDIGGSRDYTCHVLGLNDG